MLVFDYIIARETDDQFQVALLSTFDFRLNEVLRLSVVSFDDPPLPQAKVQREINDLERSKTADLYEREKLVKAENERGEELNNRIIRVLAAVSGRNADGEVSNWWQWWADYTDTQRLGDKRVVTVTEETEVVGDPSIWFYRISCFAAGTPVWTDSGLVPIEKLAIGDRVLAKDTETGELAYKTVLRTTVRPPKELTTLRFGDETIVCTGGHRFWSSGEGWVKARDLTPQTLLHTVTRNTPVWSANKGQTAETYNLVVADFHTYFVGKTGLLCQDLLIPRGTNSVVPGLARANAAAQEKR
jgi:hypothetical protein